MATGAPGLWSLLVQWDGTNYVDESAGLKAGSEVVITRGRGSTADDIQPGVLSGELDNTGGRYTPDNPLSPLWPNLNATEARTRFAVTIGGVSSDRHRGRIAVGTPDWPRGQSSEASIPFESVGRLGQLSQDPLTVDFVERNLQVAETHVVDVWPLDEVVDGSTTSLRNVGSGTGAAAVVRPRSGAGQVTSAAVDGIDLESSVVVTTSNTIGPVVVLTTGIDATAGAVGLVVVPFRTTDRTTGGGPDKYLVSGWTYRNAIAWSVRLVDNGGQTDLNLYDGSGAFVATLYFGFAPGSGSTDGGDDRWFDLIVQWQSGTGQTYFGIRRTDDGTIVGSTLSGVIAANVTKCVVLGGSMSPATPGKQSQCVTAAFGACVMSDSALDLWDTLLTPNTTVTVQQRFVDLNLYADFPSTQTGARNTLVRRKSLAGRDPLTVIAELCRTTGAVVVEYRTSDDSLLFIDADLQRSATVALQVDISGDVDGTGGFPTRKGGTPSLVTASWTGGKATYQDTSRRVVSKTVETCAADDGHARNVAAYYVNAGGRLRIEKLRLDLSGSAAALWPTVKDLEIGARIRVVLGTAGSPFVTQWGRTYVDVYAVGWTERYRFDRAVWEIDTEPADDPVVGEFGTGPRRKFAAAPGAMTITAGTCVGGTGTGTVVVTTAFGPTMTTTVGAYPLDLDWNGEHITVSGPPAGSTSPQTLTVSARAVNGTVARVHGTGESVNVALAAAFAL